MIEEGFYWVRVSVPGLDVQVAHRWRDFWWLVGTASPFPDSEIEVIEQIKLPINASN